MGEMRGISQCGVGTELQLIDEKLLAPQWDPDEAGACSQSQRQRRGTEQRPISSEWEALSCQQKVPGERKQPRSGSARILKFVGRAAKGTERRVPRCGDVGEAT